MYLPEHGGNLLIFGMSFKKNSQAGIKGFT